MLAELQRGVEHFHTRNWLALKHGQKLEQQYQAQLQDWCRLSRAALHLVSRATPTKHACAQFVPRYLSEDVPKTLRRYTIDADENKDIPDPNYGTDPVPMNIRQYIPYAPKWTTWPDYQRVSLPASAEMHHRF